MKLLPIVTTLFISTLPLFADMARISGRGEANYTNPIGKPGKEVEAAARKEAIYNAVDRALEGQSDALREQFKKFGKTLTPEEYEAKGIVTESRKATAIPDPKHERLSRALSAGKPTTSETASRRFKSSSRSTSFVVS
jgi:hypothetical protein